MLDKCRTCDYTTEHQTAREKRMRNYRSIRVYFQTWQKLTEITAVTGETFTLLIDRLAVKERECMREEARIKSAQQQEGNDIDD